ncbi:DNA-binding response regulator [Hylemonella gracilis]|uniref:DNA-binding response regulator n=1 Tax=Hylemonella gracilis TaxID=80880 RepID=A0A4P6US51_9BURK|nr:response regulator transcription factor [Hylemonella gracilis]QBK06651.1 DNA-binding response regulator [Hylemonella gracilis]
MNAVNVPHILVVDDEPAITEMVGQYLSEHDFRVSVARNGTEMHQVLQQASVQLVLMDLRLRGENGLTLARDLRERLALPVIILTGQAEEADRVMGLELAADDYVVKPFSLRELLARIRAVLRRYPPCASEAASASADAGPAVRAYRFDGWELNLGLRRLRAPDAREIELSLGEFSLLQALCRAPGRVLSRDQLLDMTRRDADAVYDRAIDVQILRLRRKIELDPSTPRYIRTERGAGYVFDTAVEALT